MSLLHKLKNNLSISLSVLFCALTITAFAQIVTDIDGNIYNTIVIGNQTWLQQDLKVLHYPDGSVITEVWSYNDDDSLANIYGRLYTWDASMNYSTEEKSQGICPDGWHIPSDGEWTDLGNFLGGNNLAGGKLKESGTDHWMLPNSGATNESGFTALPAGEYDDTHYQFLGMYNVIWSSTQANSVYAKYRYLNFEDEALHTYTYFKDFRYSVRCIKNLTVGINNKPKKELRIFPNPVGMVLNIKQSINNENQKVTIYNQLGEKVKNFIITDQNHSEDMQILNPGIYLLIIENNTTTNYLKILKK
ncbi:MAG: T9SS type A sorting domain-containing protein [Bacteroidetes bacterium]|nr:T9SS type A sorting domain-containing protein [Bacteroidota bacterium]